MTTGVNGVIAMGQDASSSRMTVVRIPTVGLMLEAELAAPDRPAGVAVIVPGVGQARRRPHLRATLARLAEAGWVTVLVELLTPREELLDEQTLTLRLDNGLLAGRIAGVLDWLLEQHQTAALPVGILGAGRGAAAGLLAAARRPEAVGALVSRGLRLGLGADTLTRVVAPTLLITADRPAVGGDVSRRTAERLGGPHELRVVADADVRFLAPDPLEQVLGLTCSWFTRHLTLPGTAA